MNDVTKGALLCLGMLVLMAVAGTCDYRDATHFVRDGEAEVNRTMNRAVIPDSARAYVVLRQVYGPDERIGPQ